MLTTTLNYTSPIKDEQTRRHKVVVLKKTTAELLIQKLRVFPLHLIKLWIETSSHHILRTADGGN